MLIETSEIKSRIFCSFNEFSNDYIEVYSDTPKFKVYHLKWDQIRYCTYRILPNEGYTHLSEFVFTLLDCEYYVKVKSVRQFTEDTGNDQGDYFKQLISKLEDLSILTTYN